MKVLRKLARSWAVRASKDSGACWGSVFMAVAAIFLFGIYFFVLMPGGALMPAGVVLANGVLALMVSCMLFERAGFVELLKEREKKERRGDSSRSTGSRNPVHRPSL